MHDPRRLFEEGDPLTAATATRVVAQRERLPWPLTRALKFVSYRGRVANTLRTGTDPGSAVIV